MLRTQRGDTIIEVLLAITVFSLVAVIVIAVMNQATNAAQRSLEITHVRQQIDAQAEALRAAHQAYSRMVTSAQRDGSVWKQLTNGPTGSIPPSTAGCPATAQLSSMLAMNPQNAGLLSDIKSIDEASTPYARVLGGTTYGLWIEQAKSPGTFTPAAYDFRIRACWYGAGSGETPMQIETIVRLYDVDLT